MKLGEEEQAPTTAGWLKVYIPTHRKSAMDGAPERLWLVKFKNGQQRSQSSVVDEI